MRILTWHDKDAGGGGQRFGPSFYLETDYVPAAVRLEAEKAPLDGDMEVDIFDDGVSIFDDHASFSSQTAHKGSLTRTGDVNTSVSLAQAQTEEELAANDFTGDTLEKGSWVTCKILNARGAKNLTVHLELMEFGE